MKFRSHLLWALGVNGEGSSRVTFAFIKSICSGNSLSLSKVTIVYSSGSTLSQLISSFLESMPLVSSYPNVRFVKLPKIARNYLLHFIIKFCAGPLLAFDSVVVFDDFPFRFLPRQVLYFHQPNLVYNSSMFWCVKRLTFRLLLSPSLTIYMQTLHMRDSFISTFGFFKTICFLHDLI